MGARGPPPGSDRAGWFLALSMWIVRIWYPVGKWVPLLFVLPVEPAHLPEYVSMFALGVMAWRGDWLRRMPVRTGLTWLCIGVAAAGSVFAAQAFGWWNDLLTAGGLDWPSLARSTCEALICAGLSIGLIVAFRQLFRQPSRLLATLAAASYAAYILHLSIVISLQNLLKPTTFPAAAKFALVAVLGIMLSFGLALLSRRIPGLRIILETGQGRSRQAGETASEPGRTTTADEDAVGVCGDVLGGPGPGCSPVEVPGPPVPGSLHAVALARTSASQPDHWWKS